VGGPYVWRSEFRNVLALYIRRGLIAVETALRYVEEAENHLAGNEYFVASQRVIARAATSRCSAYDCEFVVLAEQLRIPLITTDKQILAEFPSVAVALSEFAVS
jgi:predicted nucleic acid-binding protein